MPPLILKYKHIKTPLGELIATSDDEALYFLEFADKVMPNHLHNKLKLLGATKIIADKSAAILSIEDELKEYFAKKRTKFTTPFKLIGTEFQKKAWLALCDIPFGETRSYAEQACLIKRENAHRAVANANARNKLVIIVPCHRIITSQGTLGGYGGGTERKLWLLEHEGANTNKSSLKAHK
ncbi:MAG: methylated-DNA--[protein]-cysteine S-methyltransferase [Legionellaceae bacterium]|nr:methylated-DNA--[protein]-cysteine S-methyltransferase [Legionellaceae bacterium]